MKVKLLMLALLALQLLRPSAGAGGSGRGCKHGQPSSP